MMLPFTIALRFLFRSIRYRPLTFFSLVSVLGIAFSIMLFVLIDSLINGLSANLKQTLIGFESPLSFTVAAESSDKSFQALEKFQNKHPEFHLNFFLSSQFDGLVQVPGAAASGATVRSVDSEFFSNKKNQIEVLWFEGYDEVRFNQSDNLVLVGESLYERLRFMPGTEELLILTHPFADLGPSGDVEPAEKQFEVAGVFHTGRDDFDDVFALIPKTALLGWGDPMMFTTQFFITPEKLSDVARVQKKWRDENPNEISLQSWTDKNQSVLKAMRLESLLYLCILLLVVLISCFNLAGVVAIFSTSKSEDAAVLRALGLSLKQIRGVFIYVGVILGALGSMIGLSFAVVLVELAEHSHLSLPRAYGFTELPLALNNTTIVLVLVATPVVAALIALFPASQFVKRTISEVLRMS